MLPKINPITLPEWKALEYHHSNRIVNLRDAFVQDSDRFEKFSIKLENFLFDYSKNLICEETMRLLTELAIACKLPSSIEAYFGGEIINETEKRAVLHTALRSSNPKNTIVNGKEMYPEIQAVIEKMKNFSHNVITGKYKGYTDKKITDIVNIGIGGSDLGPKMVVESLKEFSSGLKIHFVSNVDYAQIHHIFKQINPEQTIFIIASKTFTTQETMTNAHTAKKWFLENGAKEKDIAKHFVALSTSQDAVKNFGIVEENRFEFWDWVGGRFSLWSAIGLSIMLSIGHENFSKLLQGAESIDNHFRHTKLDKNIPVIMALLGIWYRNFYQMETYAILPYSQSLDLLPDYLQQLDMESNGKSTDRCGNRISYDTSPIIWGRAGTNGQHAFYQLMHQGSSIVPADFIGFVNDSYSQKEHHQKLMANFFAQTEVLAFGKTKKELEEENTDILTLPHKVFEGNRPTNSILFQELTPYTLGQIIALYEHKTFVQGAIWNIFSYDQFGVELGKTMANNILQEFKLKEIKNHDSSTNGLINYFIHHKKS